MSKWYGIIGFAVQKETSPGVYSEVIDERNYVGDISRNQRKWENGDGLNDNINIDNVISILADPYACRNFHTIRYITFMGSKWKVRSVDVAYPRLNFAIGGVYNEESS